MGDHQHHIVFLILDKKAFAMAAGPILARMPAFLDGEKGRVAVKGMGNPQRLKEIKKVLFRGSHGHGVVDWGNDLKANFVKQAKIPVAFEGVFIIFRPLPKGFPFGAWIARV